jgi:hypothetical protein
MCRAFAILATGPRLRIRVKAALAAVVKKEFSMSDFWWGVIVVMIYIPLLFLWGFTLVAIFIRKDMHAWSKLLWALLVLFVPIIGVILYWVACPRDYDDVRVNNAVGYDPLPPLPAVQTQAVDLAALSHMHDEGKLSDSEYDNIRQRLAAA